MWTLPAPRFGRAGLLILLLAGLPLAAGRARADEATYRGLVERATHILQEAEAHQQAGRHSQARDQAKRAGALIAQADHMKPEEMDTAFLGVQASVLAGDRAAAVTWVARYEKRNPYGEKDPKLHFARALILLLLDGRPADAVRSLDAMAKLEPRGLGRPAGLLLYAALMELGRRLADAGHVDGAVARFRRAAQTAARLGDGRKEAAARANGGITLLAFGRAADAGRLFEGLHRQAPDNPLFAFYLGRALRLQERIEEAARPLERVAAAVDAGQVPPLHAELLRQAYLELGMVRRAQGRLAGDPARRAEAWGRARRAFERFTVVAPKVAGGWHRLGRLLADDLDLPYEAIAPLERAHALDPACDGALRLLLGIAGRHGPPPGDGAALSPEAWAERRAAWQADLEAHADAWRAERDRRRQVSHDGRDGCP